MSEHTSYNTQPAGLEKWLDEMYKKSPVHLPAGFQKWLADNVWWLALVGGVLSVLSAFSLWRSATTVSQLSDYAQSYGFGGYYGQSTGFLWAMLVVTLAEAALLLMAFQKLKTHSKDGWNLLFYISLLSTVGSLVAYAISSSNIVSSVVGIVIGSLIGWFFLFEIRSHFK